MPNRCVVGGCSNGPDLQKGIALHNIPFWGDDRPEAQKRKKRWVNFVKAKRAKWELTKGSTICSKHFMAEDFERRFSNIEGQTKACIPRLKRDDFGVVVFPSVNAKELQTREEENPASARSARARRKIVKEIISQPSTSKEGCDGDGVEVMEAPVVEDQTSEDIHVQPEGEVLVIKESTVPDVTQSADRLRSNMIISLRSRLNNKNKELRLERSKNQELQRRLLPEQNPCSESKDCTDDEVADGGDDQAAPYVDHSDSESCHDPEVESEYETETETETETTVSVTEEPVETTSKRLFVEDDNLRTQPKHIVFLSQLLLLFQVCHSCQARNPLVEAKQVGTMVAVTTDCTNPKCSKKHYEWCSQPNMPGTRVPAGNFLLCMAILLSGGSATKVFNMFAHLGLGCISLNSFFFHQKTKLFPTILLFWKTYQTKMIEKVKALGVGLTIAGDGRHDSMGHCAKFGAYTIFCCTLPMILHFALIQRNQAGNSPAMEFMGFQQTMEHLLGLGLVISTFISDRHITIASHMKKVYTNITHYFDLWHIKKKIRKVLSKISKETGCEVLCDWIKPCENHFYWSATSTFSGNGIIIWAKFKSFLSHIINKHSNLDDPVFNKCQHGEIPDRKWLHKDSTVYEQVVKALTNNSLVKGIKQASPFSQTSCLEGFHSVVNQFAPKMIAYSYVGQYCRHILAAVHFNFNLNREIKVGKDGHERIKVVYPKFKNGEATVRDVRITPNFDYVEEIYQTFLKANEQGQLPNAARELADMTPPPMDSMLQKQPKADALKKRAEQKSMIVKDVPPTAPVPPIAEQTQVNHAAPKAKPHCSTCKRPMKGHKNVLDCPKNKKND